MLTRLLVYGATGYTGRLIVDQALAFGMRPVLAGRSADALGALARAGDLEFRTALLDDRAATARLLDGMDVLLNVAGPFRSTALPLARACVDQGTHYLDLSGEVAAAESIAALDGAARARGVMLMPAIGFDAVPSDCMAVWAVNALPTASELHIGIRGLDAISRGSAASLFEGSDGFILVRRAGKLTRARPGELTRDFDFGGGLTRATALPWVDLVTAHHSTRIPNITVYYEATRLVEIGLVLAEIGRPFLSLPGAKAWWNAGTRLLRPGPDAAYRARQRAQVVVEARDSAGRSAAVRLDTPEVYAFSATSAVAIADRVLHGSFSPGFQTAGSVYGSQFVLSLPSVERTLLSVPHHA
jgi:short subunit dehydrogenase-like uncharacterized protein